MSYLVAQGKFQGNLVLSCCWQDLAECSILWETFIFRQPTQAQLRVCHLRSRMALTPFSLVATHILIFLISRKHYQMGKHLAFLEPMMSECFVSSVALGGALASSLTTPIFRLDQHMPPLPLTGPTLRLTCSVEDEIYKVNSSPSLMQLRQL